MLKFLFSLFFLSLFPAQAMIEESATDERASSGRFPLYQVEKENSTGVRGNATLFRTEDGRCFGITCAHCSPYLDSFSLIESGTKCEEDWKLTSYSVVCNIQKHPFFRDLKEGLFEPDLIKNDIALFTTGISPTLSFFAGEISTKKLEEGMAYPVRIAGFGPSFSESDSLYSYTENDYFRREMSLQFSKNGLLFYSFESNIFCCSFFPKEEGVFEVNFDLLNRSKEGSLLKGNSGSLAVDADGKAFAIASCVKFDARKLIDSLKLSTGEEISQRSKISEEQEETLIQEIKKGVADSLQVITTASGGVHHIFQLKEGLPLIKGTNYFTPLFLHEDFIKEYVRTVPSVQIEEEISLEAPGAENPELAAEYAKMRSSRISKENEENELAKKLSQADKSLLDKLFLEDFLED